MGVSVAYILEQIEECHMKTPTVCNVDYAWGLHVGVLCGGVWGAPDYIWLIQSAGDISGRLQKNRNGNNVVNQ